MEPNYVGANGRIDSIAAAWLLDEDHVFFLDDEITWDGKRHGFAGVQLNSSNAEEAPVLMSNIEMIANGVLDLMSNLENDDVLRVPRAAIHQALHEAIREGDLTGITLFNLIACGHAIKIVRSDDNVYQVIHDNRLARGIPAFYKLVARMIWGMRGYNGIEGAFQVMFVSARNIDADQYLRDFNGMVPGAISEAIWTEEVASPPSVQLPTKEDVSSYNEETAQEFLGGFDAPTEMQADEEMFESLLSSLAGEFPKTISIEGTHVLGRAARIEGIKVGDPVVLASDWRSPYFSPVCIEVFNKSGETLGNLNEQFSPALTGNREIACLLPYLTASVASVTPLSQRRKGSKYALMDIKMELDETILEAGIWPVRLVRSVIDDAKKLLSLPAEKRIVLSKGELVASDLRGNVNAEMAADIPNPIGSVYVEIDANSGMKGFGEAAENGEGEVDERQAMISVLRVLVLSGQLAGSAEFPQELLDELDRAENGDDSIDIDELAKRLNECVPDSKAADLSSVTFEKGLKAKGRRFTVAVPDGWSIVENYEEGGFLGSSTRPFVAVQGEVLDAENLQLRDRIIYSDMGGDIEVLEPYMECGTSDLKWALTMVARYDRSDNEGIMGLRPNVVWDEEIKAVNTRCFVSQNQANEGINGLEIYVQPYALDHNDFLRLVFTYENEDNVGLARELAKSIASTVELDEPIVPKCELVLASALKGRIPVDEFVEMVELFAQPYLALRQNVFTSYQYKYATNTDSFNETECMISGARGIAEFNRRAACVFQRLMDAYDVQVASGSTINDLDKLLECLSVFKDNVFATEDSFEATEAKVIGDAGIFASIEEVVSASNRLDYAKGHGGMASVPGGAVSSGGAAGVTYSRSNSDAMRKWRSIDEPHETPAIARIEKSLNEKVSSLYFIETSEIAANALMSDRQSACDSVVTSWNSDEDNVTNMAREVGRYNAIICRYYGYFVDALEAQVELGNTPGEIRKMAAEVNEFGELIADRFSCGDEYLDAVANSRSPVKRPDEYLGIRDRWQAVNSRF